MHGLAALSWFLGTDGDGVLTCARWASDAAYYAYLRGSGFTAALAGPPRYRLYLSLAVADETRTPGCLVTAAFDSDGAGRQRAFTDAVTAAQPRDGEHPGDLGALPAQRRRHPDQRRAHQETAEAGHHDKGYEIFAGTTGPTAHPPKAVPPSPVPVPAASLIRPIQGTRRGAPALSRGRDRTRNGSPRPTLR
ncbi:hypothetical protein [Streptomyces bullii]|uniref:Antibiotic biosynthesis monooxygenase n=1 Tax=Streptomyces bullii TaxID=349910 RepID=A0ABW0V3X0_9ACTN